MVENQQEADLSENEELGDDGNGGGSAGLIRVGRLLNALQYM